MAASMPARFKRGLSQIAQHACDFGGERWRHVPKRGSVVHGFASLDPAVNVAGVIFNRVGSARHESMLCQAMAKLDVPVLGAVPRSADLDLDSRHLGLVQAGDQISVQQAQTQWADALRPHVDLDAIASIMAPVSTEVMAEAPIFHLAHGRSIAIADDAAFRFCYGHWKHADAQTFSPLANQPVPQDAEFVFLPGGYPELAFASPARADVFWRSLRQRRMQACRFTVSVVAIWFLVGAFRMKAAHGHRRLVCCRLPPVLSSVGATWAIAGLKP